jgi:hypothetical protein
MGHVTLTQVELIEPTGYPHDVTAGANVPLGNPTSVKVVFYGDEGLTDYDLGGAILESWPSITYTETVSGTPYPKYLQINVGSTFSMAPTSGAVLGWFDRTLTGMADRVEVRLNTSNVADAGKTVKVAFVFPDLVDGA